MIKKQSIRKICTLFILLALMLPLSGCGRTEGSQRVHIDPESWKPERNMDLQYATEFNVDYYPGGYKLLRISDGNQFLVIPEGSSMPEGLDESIIPIQQPVKNLYLAASAAMCLFDSLDRIDAIRLSGTREDAWTIDNAKKAMQEGDILFAGKYSEPDFELLLKEKAPLAIESRMIGYASEAKEKLEELGIPVLVDQSSLESHPLGRFEWIKLYAAMLNEEEKADAVFDEQVKFMKEAEGALPSGKSVVFFCINSKDIPVVRKGGDYVSKMIELAGGEYVFKGIGDPEKKSSTTEIEMEAFYAKAKDADIMIYDSTTGSEIHYIQELLDKNPLLSECKAVKNGDVWCNSKGMYQSSAHLGRMILSMQQIFSGEAKEKDDVPFFYHLN